MTKPVQGSYAMWHSLIWPEKVIVSLTVFAVFVFVVWEVSVGK